MAQVTGNLESQRRQYDLAGAAEKAGFASVTVIDDGSWTLRFHARFKSAEIAISEEASSIQTGQRA